jgi:hypothetical protein
MENCKEEGKSHYFNRRQMEEERESAMIQVKKR